MAHFQTHTAGALPRLASCSVMCEESPVWEQRKAEWTQLDANSQGESPLHPNPLPLQIYGLTCAPRSGQTPLFHFLRLPRCRSNSGEANAGRLLNYERWAWVIPVIKFKGAGPVPHGTTVLLCGLHLAPWPSDEIPSVCTKAVKTSGISFYLTNHVSAREKLNIWCADHTANPTL